MFYDRSKRSSDKILGEYFAMYGQIGAQLGARATRFCMVAVLGLSLSGCGATSGISNFFSGSDDVPLEQRGPEVLFSDAERLLRNEKQREAAHLFDEVERLYPYSERAKDAMLMSAVASYQGEDFDSAVTAAERFIGFYPSDEKTAYARYILAQSYYDQIVDVGRDQGTTRQARQSLESLIARHPDSSYTKDAQLKLDTTLDQLAGKEMEVGRYYLKRGAYRAAIPRFQSVVRDYDTTSHVEEALHRLVEANLALGLVDEAKKSAAVLGHNSPGSDWYSDSYALITATGAEIGAKDTWYNRAYRQVIRGDWL